VPNTDSYVRGIRRDIMRVVRLLEENPDDSEYAIFELEDIIAEIDEMDLRQARMMRSPKRKSSKLVSRKPKRATKKRAKSKKVRVLDEMAKKAWDKYKKGSGKKSYVDIRAQVSRSRDYKKKVKNL